MLFSTCNRFVFRQKIKIYIGGGEFPKGGRYPRIFVPPGVIFLGISPLFWEGESESPGGGGRNSCDEMPANRRLYEAQPE
jgi:hypothetical protein